MSKKDIFEEMHLTVAQLKEILEDLPDDTKIIYERIPDVYFNERGWDSISIHSKTPVWYSSELEEIECIPVIEVYFSEDDHLVLSAHY